jgi:hypothetical protein
MPLFIIGGIVFAAAMAFVLGVVVMALWNWLMPDIFGLTTITYWQAWGIVLLAHILFKTGNHSRHWREDRHNGAWKEKFRSRFKDWSSRHDESDSSEPSTEDL